MDICLDDYRLTLNGIHILVRQCQVSASGPKVSGRFLFRKLLMARHPSQPLVVIVARFIGCFPVLSREENGSAQGRNTMPLLRR